MADYLTADEAAAYLGVSRATLYAYVSRGLVVSEPTRDSRSHRYPRSALDELRDRRERRREPDLGARNALRWGAPMLDSTITLIADGRLWYRGRDARELSRTATFEQVACLLWTGAMDHAAELFLRSPSPRRKLRADRSFADLLVASLVERRAEPAVTIAEPSVAALRAAARVVRQLFEAAGARGRGTLAERLARGWSAPSAEDLDAALILCADHELNTSSFTARCVASTDAPLENVLLAALCALEGRRHGGAVNQDVEELLRSAERDGVQRACRKAVSRSGGLPGFGAAHPLYPRGDPRAEELLSRIALSERAPLSQIIAFGREELGLYPGTEFALAALARAAALPPGIAFALFALGRSAGWIAHALETAAEGRLIRPRARYVGPAPRVAW